MKAFLFAGILPALVAVSLGGSCALPNYTGFCSGAVSANHTTDSIINNYLPTIESALTQYFPGFKQALQTVAQHVGFTFCDDCWTALEHLVCVAAEPSCGFLQCFTDSSSAITACTQSCATTCKGGASSNLNANCWTCIANCYATAIFSKCNSTMMSTQMCTDFLNICGCHPAANVIDSVCSLFDPSGYYIPLPAGLACESSEGWCNSNTHGSLQAQAGQICPNPNVCFMVPQSVGQTDITNPVTLPAVSSAWTVSASIFLIGISLFV